MLLLSGRALESRLLVRAERVLRASYPSVVSSSHVVVLNLSVLPHLACLRLRCAPVRRVHVLARVPVDGSAVSLGRVVDGLGVVAVRRVAKLVHSVLLRAAAPRIRAEELAVVPLLVRRLEVVLSGATTYLLLLCGSARPASCRHGVARVPLGGEGRVLGERVVVAALALDRAVVHVAGHHFALLAVDQVVFIYVFRDGLLARRLRAAALAHRGRAARALRVLSARDIATSDRAPCRGPDGRRLGGDLLDGAIQIAAVLHNLVLNAFGGDGAASLRLDGVPRAVLHAIQLLAAAQIVAHLLLDDDGVLGELTQLLLGIRVSD